MSLGYQVSPSSAFTSWVAPLFAGFYRFLISTTTRERILSNHLNGSILEEVYFCIVCSYSKTCLVRHSNIRGTIHMLADETCSSAYCRSHSIRTINYWSRKTTLRYISTRLQPQKKKERSVAGEEFDKPLLPNFSQRGLTAWPQDLTDQLCLIYA